MQETTLRAIDGNGHMPDEALPWRRTPFSERDPGPDLARQVLYLRSVLAHVVDRLNYLESWADESDLPRLDPADFPEPEPGEAFLDYFTGYSAGEIP